MCMKLNDHYDMFALFLQCLYVLKQMLDIAGFTTLILMNKSTCFSTSVTIW